MEEKRIPGQRKVYGIWMEKEGIPVYEAPAGVEDITEMSSSSAATTVSQTGTVDRLIISLPVKNGTTPLQGRAWRQGVESKLEGGWYLRPAKRVVPPAFQYREPARQSAKGDRWWKRVWPAQVGG